MNALSNVCVRMSVTGQRGLILSCLTVCVLGVVSPAAQAQTGTLSGHVLRDADGTPLANAWVSLFQGDDPNVADEGAWNWVDNAFTDANGLYTFTDLAERRYRVRVMRDKIAGTDYCEANLYNVEVRADCETVAVDIRLKEGGGLSGHVFRHADGVPLVNRDVYLYQGEDPDIADEDATDFVDETWTNTDGYYSFAGLTERRYRVYVPGQAVSGTSYFEANLYNVQVLDSSQTTDMDLRLRQAGLIYGYVKTQAGDPVPYAEVIAEASWTEDGDSRHSTSTDETGRYEFPLAPSPGKFYPVWVSSASLDGTNYASAWDGSLYQATLAGTQVPDYVLEPGGTVTGRVVNESGVGIGGVRVKVSESPVGDVGPDAWTDGDGYFELPGVALGVNYVETDNEDQEIEQDGIKYMSGETCPGPVEVSAGQTVDMGTFTIYEAGMVTGVVTDEAGLPVVDAEVEVEGRDLNGCGADRDEVTTDAFGQYTVDYIAPGTYRLLCYKDGFIVTVEGSVVIERGQHVERDLVLQSAEEAATLQGRITNYATIRAKDSQGVPLPCYEDDYEDWGYPWLCILAISTDQVWTERHFLDPGAWILFERDLEDIDDGYADYFETDATEVPGQYGPWRLPPGNVVFAMLYGQDGEPGDGGISSIVFGAARQLSLSRGDVRTNVDFTWEAPTNPGILKGRLNVPAGYSDFAENWAMVYAYRLDSNGNIVTSWPLGDALGDPGRARAYEIRNLSAGTYRLRAYARNLASVVIDSVTVVAGQTTTQDITFTAGGTLAGQVTDGAGPISGATVTVTETGTEGITDASGSYSIPGLNTGSYTVTVSASGYADAQETASITDGSTTTRNFALSNTAGSIAGTVKDSQGVNINGVTVLAYNETDRSQKSNVTVAGAFTIEPLTPGNYILAVDAGQYGVVVYPADPGRITLGANEDVNGIAIVVGSAVPPEFSVRSSVGAGSPTVLTLEFTSDQDLSAAPSVSVASGAGALGSLTSNSALNRFEIEYTADANDALVLIRIEETSPLVSGHPGAQTFSFEVGGNLVMTSTTNVTNATGGTACIMGTQDNTQVYVPPFAIAGSGASESIPLTIERYGDPGDAVAGDANETVTAVYDFKFDGDGLSVDENHTFTVTMSFQLPSGMTQEEFEDSLKIKYFDAGEQKWKTDGISNIRINWVNQTVMFDVSHLTKFAGFVGEGAGPLLHDWNGDGIVSIVGDVPPFVQCVYFGNYPAGVDAIAVGDCNGDNLLSIVGDVPCFVQCVYFGHCDE